MNLLVFCCLFDLFQYHFYSISYFSNTTSTLLCVYSLRGIYNRRFSSYCFTRVDYLYKSRLNIAGDYRGKQGTFHISVANTVIPHYLPSLDTLVPDITRNTRYSVNTFAIFKDCVVFLVEAITEESWKWSYICHPIEDLAHNNLSFSGCTEQLHRKITVLKTYLTDIYWHFCPFCSFELEQVKDGWN